ncbi:MAG: type II toxin-antitoxin system RelE/ParE family toxin [Candidatus Neomarinimicrobiota bacterium]
MPPPYYIQIERRALKMLMALPNRIRMQIRKAIDSLALNPRPDGVRKLAATNNIYRIRVGQYRVVYAIKDKELRILVIKIGHRKDIYRP